MRIFRGCCWLVMLLLLPIYAQPERAASQGCHPVYQIHLPFLLRSAMLITRFGDDYDTAYTFPLESVEDDWQTKRPGAVRDVPNAGGSFDFWAANASPIEAVTVSKSFYIRGVTAWRECSGGIYVYVDEILYTKSLVGIDTAFTSEVSVGDYMQWTYGGTVYTYRVEGITSDGVLTFGAADATLPIMAAPVPYRVSSALTADDDYTEVERLLELLKAAVLTGESKLWADVRDGSHRFAVAKCTKCSIPERFDSHDVVKVDLEFYMREGIWWSEDPHTVTLATWSGPGVDFENAGNIAAPILLTIHAGSTAITYFKIFESAAPMPVIYEYSGTISAGHDMLIDAGRYSVKNNSVGCYADMTVLDWLSIPPGGVNLYQPVLTGGGTGREITFTWRDAWV